VTDPQANLVEQAGLGLPYERKRVVRRALMRLPWRMFVGRQVEFNRAAAEEIAALRRTVRRLRAEVDSIAELVAQSQRDSGALAVREQLYRTEGELRRDLSALQIEVERLTSEARSS
jgi:hypothetical protein